MAEKQSDIFIEDGLFAVDDDMEKMRLHGNYHIKNIRNKADLPTEDIDELENIRNQSVFIVGNVLIRTCTEDILDLIDVFIRYTHDPCKDLKLDMINEVKQMIGGTICPTKKTLFTYKSKVFVAYGRYIFGYDKMFADFKRLNYAKSDPHCDKNVDKTTGDSSNDDIDDEDEDEDEERCEISDHKLTADRILLKNPDYEKEADDYVYSFCIFDKETGVLDAFGLYR